MIFTTSRLNDDHIAPGCVWLASPDPLGDKASRPVSIGRQLNSMEAFIIPGTSVCHTERCPVKVGREECRFLHSDTYFLARESKRISLDNLTKYLGTLPRDIRERLGEKVSVMLLKKYGIHDGLGEEHER